MEAALKTVLCQHCSKEFSAYVTHRDAKYCSGECYRLARVGVKRGSRTPIITKQCIACGQDFLTGSSRSGLAKRTARYCSLLCRNKGRVVPSKQTARILTEAQKGYVAGFMDGEGTISLQWHTHGLRLRLSAVNTNKEALDKLCEWTGAGAVFIGHEQTEKRQRTYTWSYSSRVAYEVLQQILPHLIIKKEQALLCMSAYERLQDHRQKFDTRWQKEYLAQITKLNARGVAKLAILQEAILVDLEE